MTTITPARLVELQSSGAKLKLVDVRTPAEFREIHVEFAENIPLDKLDAGAIRNWAEGEPVYLICRTGNRARQACEKLEKAGLANAVNVDGGLVAWEAAGLPVLRGKKTISLERQVRIAAGFFVFAGVALGFFFNPYWLIVPAFVGAGLMFSGITDTCGMGMILARMPWNQVSSARDQSNQPAGACST